MLTSVGPHWVPSRCSSSRREHQTYLDAHSYRGALGNVEMLTPKKGASSILNAHSCKGILVSLRCSSPMRVHQAFLSAHPNRGASGNVKMFIT